MTLATVDHTLILGQGQLAALKSLVFLRVEDHQQRNEGRLPGQSIRLRLRDAGTRMVQLTDRIVDLVQISVKNLDKVPVNMVRLCSYAPLLISNKSHFCDCGFFADGDSFTTSRGG